MPSFVLSLFGALDGEHLPISILITGAGLFGIEETAMRMAVNRLARQERLPGYPRDGVYQRKSFRLGCETRRQIQ